MTKVIMLALGFIFLCPQISQGAVMIEKYGFMKPAKDKLIFTTSDTVYTLKRAPVEIRNQNRLTMNKRIYKKKPFIKDLQTKLSFAKNEIISSKKNSAVQRSR